MLQDARSLGLELDDILVSCDGGARCHGCISARMHAAERLGFEDMAQSIALGVRERNALLTGSIRDSLLIDRPGELTFPIIAGRVHSGIAVNDPMSRKQWPSYSTDPPLRKSDAVS